VHVNFKQNPISHNFHKLKIPGPSAATLRSPQKAKTRARKARKLMWLCTTSHFNQDISWLL